MAANYFIILPRKTYVLTKKVFLEDGKRIKINLHLMALQHRKPTLRATKTKNKSIKMEFWKKVLFVAAATLSPTGAATIIVISGKPLLMAVVFTQSDF